MRSATSAIIMCCTIAVHRDALTHGVGAAFITEGEQPC